MRPSSQWPVHWQHAALGCSQRCPTSMQQPLSCVQPRVTSTSRSVAPCLPSVQQHTLHTHQGSTELRYESS
jgi:hypothetical protein